MTIAVVWPELYSAEITETTDILFARSRSPSVVIYSTMWINTQSKTENSAVEKSSKRIFHHPGEKEANPTKLISIFHQRVTKLFLFNLNLSSDEENKPMFSKYLSNVDNPLLLLLLLLHAKNL